MSIQIPNLMSLILASNDIKDLHDLFSQGIVHKKIGDGHFSPTDYLASVNSFLKLPQETKLELIRQINSASGDDNLVDGSNDPAPKVSIISNLRDSISTVNRILSDDNGREWFQDVIRNCKSQCRDFLKTIRRFKNNTTKLLPA